jgi:hypothetical protein
MSDLASLGLLSLRETAIEEDPPSNSVENYRALLKKIDNIKTKLDETFSQLRNMCHDNEIFCKDQFVLDKDVIMAVTLALFDVFQRKAFLSIEGKSNFDADVVSEILLVFIIIIAIFNIIVIFITIIIFRSSFFI